MTSENHKQIIIILVLPVTTCRFNWYTYVTYLKVPKPLEGARWSSGINAANGARGPRCASRILPTYRAATLDKSL